MKQLPKKVRNNLYVDDFAIYYSSRCARHLQRIINKAATNVYHWCKSVGLKLALNKTQGIIFYRSISWLKDHKMKIKIGNHNVEIKKSVKFLGLYFDSHLNWKTHLIYIKGKALSAPNLIKKLSPPLFFNHPL